MTISKANMNTVNGDKLMTRFYEKYLELCASSGMTPNGAAKIIGIPSASITDWKKGSMPRSNAIEKISTYFGVTTDYLLGYEDIKEKPTLNEGELDLSGISAAKRDFIFDILDLNDDQVQALSALVVKLKAGR